MRQNSKRFFRWLLLGSAVVLFSGCVSETERYQPAPTEELTIREIPASRQLRTSMPGDYFQVDGILFRRLFDYLKAHDLTMTVPVIAEIGDPCSMIFYVADGEKERAAKSEGNVMVVDVPAVTVALLAFRGENNRISFQNGERELQRLLEEDGRYLVAGDGYVTYWDAPMWPAFLRHYEITVPVKLR